ncbi:MULTISPECIES: major capsid family protein [Enterobacteriaceae]|uniref:major capsid family protein n=1 Tax=Enterobacteriaceae TaxID=543 RepID=UPI002E2921B2|nr:major capsid family protein [Klebsiella pneumoniae]MED6004925.1 major capsid family protein [Klebsiella pneumoniae]MED6058261.1 major capsid family protein [Klebsiella pneumoniae]
MALEDVEIQTILEEKLTERDEQLQETVLPEINVGEALPIDESLDLADKYAEFGVVTVVGSVKDGIISGNGKTNSLRTIDSDIEWKKAPVGNWAKAATWTSQELRTVARLGQNLDTVKLDNLYNNAVATIQYAGYLGHQDIKGQEGLLTGSGVQVVNEAKGIDEMTADEAVAFILGLFNRSWAASGYRVMPTHIAMDAGDFMLLMQKFNPNGTIVGADLLPISAMDRIMAALKKANNDTAVNLTFVKIPSKYAVGIKSGKTRMVVYVYDPLYVEMRVHMPELLPVRQRDLLTWEAGYESAFGGAMWKQPKSALYADYKTTVAPAT